MKYKVILADDEEEVLYSIRRKIKWEELGFELKEVFLNGRDVLDYLEEQEADILISDIRMPFMDGLELTKQIRERYPQMKVIIISGYGEFQYAREAMTYKVTDYILKPVNSIELEEVLSKLKTAMDQEIEEKKNIRLLEQQYQANLPVIRENLLNRILTGNVAKEHLEEELDNCAIGIARAVCWNTALIQIDKLEKQEESTAMDQQLAKIYIRNLIRSHFSSGFNYALFYNMYGESIIFGMKDRSQMKKILLSLNDIARESRRIMGIQIAVGVGRIKDNLTDVKDAFEEAREALLYRKMNRDGDVIFMEDIETSGQKLVLFDEEAEYSLFSAVKFGEEKDIRQVIEDFRMQLQKANMAKGNFQAYCVSVLNALVMLTQSLGLEVEEIFGGMPDYIKILVTYDSSEQFFAWLQEQCLDIGKKAEHERRCKTAGIIEEVRDRLAKEFGNPDISMEQAAQDAGLTTTYFSSLFKKETGETFIEYLTRLRLENAMRLLGTTDEKIYVIAEKSGYTDAGYFSHVFKKKFGMSPIQCRRQQNNN